VVSVSLRSLLAVLAVALAWSLGAQQARAAQIFSNTDAITINDSPGGVAQAASPYPSEITVSGVSDAVTAVSASLHGFHHTCPQDVDVLLVGPSGGSSLLMSDAGDCTEDPNRQPIDLTFADSASSAIPCLSNGAELPAGSYRPANYPDHDCTTENPDFSDGFPTPAPPGPWPTGLTGFAGEDPNGSWKLYVVDDQNGDAGAIDGGWSLAIASASLPLPAAPKPRRIPLLSSTTRLTQRVLRTHGVLVSFSSSSGGQLVASGTVSVPKLAKLYRFTSMRKQVPAGAVRVKLGLPRSALAAVKRALKRHRKLSAKITVSLTAPDGEHTSKRLSVRLR
jgi:hypothetical protein